MFLNMFRPSTELFSSSGTVHDRSQYIPVDPKQFSVGAKLRFDRIQSLVDFVDSGVESGRGRWQDGGAGRRPERPRLPPGPRSAAVRR